MPTKANPAERSGSRETEPTSLDSVAGGFFTVHRFAVIGVCLLWPLIWVGGLVTTYDAGMAVPDWPNTYGSNLWLYPWKTWVFGPFDLFIEHGHRLLGTVVGLASILILAAALMKEKRLWVTILAGALLAMIVGQGILGGVRVLREDRTVAMIHGCFGPLCFALCAGIAAMTGSFWRFRGAQGQPALPELSKTHVLLAGFVLAVSYCQLVLGAQLRHVQPTSSPSHFTGIVALHVITAFLLWAAAAILWLKTRRCGDLTLSRPTLLLIGLLALQIGLGIGTWVVNYGWPSFLQFVPGSEGFLVRAKGYWDSLVVTAHVATGSLILAIGVLIEVRFLRVRYLSKENANAIASA